MRLFRWIVLPLALLAQAPDTVIRINVNLVQVDAIVTDSKDQPVTDLKKEDFVILQDGKPQTITNFSYVSVANPAVVRSAAARPKGAPPPPPGTIQKDKIRRTV